MPRFDIETIKQAAASRWPGILSMVSGEPESTFDGKHHPCPKCGGKDRFRLIDRNGGCLCNKCFSTKNGDGLAVVQWLTGKDFASSLELVADHLGVQPEKAKKKKTAPAEHLEFIPWNPVIVSLWCMQKKPITANAVKAIGGRVAKYRDKYRVIAIPVWGPMMRRAPPVGWVIYRSDGGKLPKWTSSKEPEWVKVKLTAGSVGGIITTEEKSEEKEIWKTEGPTDLLSLLSANPKANAFTTANGSKEKPLDWIVERCNGKTVYVVHDADKPGQEGATVVPSRGGMDRPGWCPTIATVAKEVRNVTLPFPVEPTNGPDLRDFFHGGGDWDALLGRVSLAKPWLAAKESDPLFIEEYDDDPQRLARINVDQYKKEHGGRLIFWCDEWMKWRDGRYKKIKPADLKAKVWFAIRDEFEKCYQERRKAGEKAKIQRVTRSLVSNVIGAMESVCAVSWSIPMPCWLPDRSRPHYVSAKNGILDLDAVFKVKPESECLLPHSSDWFSTSRLDYEFDSAASCPIWLDTLNYAMQGDLQRIAILQEWAGYLLTITNDLQRFLVLEGGGGNGKTVYFAAMTAMLGEDNVSNVSIESFDGQFDLGATLGKSANICGDVGVVDTIAEGILKQFTGGDFMQFDRKHVDPITARPTAKLMVAWNTRPRIRDRSMGLWRRMLMVPFNKKVTGSRRVLGMDKPDWWIEQGEAPGILLWAIEGLRRLREQGDFTRSDVCDEAMAEYRIDTNPTAEFFEEYLTAGTGEINCSRLFDLYRHWCGKMNCKPLGNRQFGKELMKALPTLDKVRYRDGNSLHWKYTGISIGTDDVHGMEVSPDSFF